MTGRLFVIWEFIGSTQPTHRSTDPLVFRHCYPVVLSSARRISPLTGLSHWHAEGSTTSACMKEGEKVNKH